MRTGRRNSRKGFTLIELSVVLVLVALVATMTVSFSVLIGNYVTKNNSAHKFYEQCAELRQTLSELVLREDEEGQACEVAESGLTGTGYALTFSENVLVITTQGGAGEEKTFSEIAELHFEVAPGGRAVKCTAVKAGEEEDGNVQTFLIALRCGTFRKTGT